MKYFWSGLIFVVISCLSALPVVAKTVHHELYTVHTFEAKEGNCKKDCAHLKVEYPLLGSFFSSELRKKINQIILKDLLGSEYSSLDDWGTRFLKDYHSFDKSPASSVPAWSHSGQISVVFISREMLGLTIHSQGYTGGAHGYAHTEFRNYDLRTGLRLGLKDLFKPGFEQALNKEAEKAFRAEKKLGPWASLEKAGYEFNNNKFAVNDNVLMTPKGLIFYFNDYEIAPYVTGPTQITVDYAPISHWIKGWGEDNALISLIQETH